MAGFWSKDKKKGKKDKGQSKVVLPDMPVSVANPGGGLKGEIEPLKPLLSDEPVSARSEDATIQLDNDTKMGLRGAADPAPNASGASNAPKEEPATPASDASADAPYDENEETMVLGKGDADSDPAVQTPPAAYDASDEETMILGRGQSTPEPTPEPAPEDSTPEPEPAPEAVAEPEPEPESTPDPVKEEEITKPDIVIRPSKSSTKSIEDDPVSRVKTLSPKLMTDAGKYEDILPSGDDEDEGDIGEIAAVYDEPDQNDGPDMQSDQGEEVDAPTDSDMDDGPAPVIDDEAEQITPVSTVKKSGMQSDAGEDEATRIFGSRRKTNKPVAPLTDVKIAGAPKIEEPIDAMANPVVGWLVIVEGPGVGNCLPLGYGTNPIGRAAELRVALTFGDSQVSRGIHATVIYDPRGREFYVQHGGGTNLTYLDDKPLLEPKQLKARDRITIGDTVLMLIPLCDENFDWQDLNDE